VIKILIVADEPSVRETLQALLEEGGHAVHAAADLIEANQVLAEHACQTTASPDVVVVDADLLPADQPEPPDSSTSSSRPSSSSTSCFQELDEHVPLIIVINQPDATAAADARRIGAYDYITKPILSPARPERVLYTIERAVERKRLLDKVQRLRTEKRAYQRHVEGETAQPGAATAPERDGPSTRRLGTADLEESNRELRTLVEIGREVSATLDMTQVLKQVSQLAADVCGAHRCTIVLIGDDGEMSTPAMSAFSDGHRDQEMWYLFKEESYPVPLSDVPEAQQVIREQSPLFIADAEASSLPKRLIEPFGIKSVLLVPLISKKWVVGLMALDNVEEGRRFTARQIDVATWIAAQATLAIENAKLYQQARRQARYGALLSLVARQANTILEPERLLPAVAKTIHEHFRYDSVIIMLVDAKARDLIIGGKAGIGTDWVPDDYRQPLDQGIIGWVARHGQCLASSDARQEERYFAPFPDRYQAGSELALPLRIEGEVIGVLDLQCQRRRRFDELDVATASTLAEQIAIALQNARLHEEEQHHVEVLTALRNIDLAINSTLSLDEVLESVYEQLSRLMDITTFYIGLYDKRKDSLRISLIVDRGRRLDPVTLDLEEDGGFAGWVVRNREPLWIDDWEREQETLPVQGIARGTPTRSLMVLPLLARDELIGVISAQSYEPHAFDEEHRRIFSGISNQVAIAVENARLFEEVKRRLKDMRLLQQVMQAGAVTLDFDKVLERTIDALHHTLGIDHLSFALPASGPPHSESTVPGTQEASSADARDRAMSLKLHPSQIGYAPETTEMRIPLDRSVAGRAYLTGEAQIIDDVRETPGYFEGAPEVLSELNVPVRVAGRVIAVLNAESPETNAFDEEDLRLFQAVAAQLGIVLENARLYQRLQEQRDELSQAYDELKEIDRLRTELVQNVSHELRTPFTLVQGYIELLMAGDLGPLSAKQREALMIIRKRIDALQRRTRDLTTLDSLSREKPMSRPVCVVEAVRCAALALKARAHSAGVRLYKELPDALPPVMANSEHLTQAFTHLIENAIKFSPDGGTITLRAWEDDSCTCVAVKDEGIGIKQEHLDRIFERFYQVDGSINRRFEGMGIGLALVWEIVEVYEGHVTVRSSPQAGSTFIVSLPQVTFPKADESFREG
jgi:GAF domain-containing protein/DNA-binding NarL/FixJ family response regulator